MPGTQGDKVAGTEQIGVIGVEFRKWFWGAGWWQIAQGLGTTFTLDTDGSHESRTQFNQCKVLSIPKGLLKVVEKLNPAQLTSSISPWIC